MASQGQKASRRSSIFEVPEHFHKDPTGSCSMFAHDPEDQPPVKQPPKVKNALETGVSKH